MTMTWDKGMSAASCTTPVLPDPPSFNGLTKLGRRIFIRLYNKYLDEVNTLKLKGSSPFVIPVSTRRDVFTKKRVAMWDMANRDYRGVTKTEWAAWFSKAFEEKPQDLEVLKKRLTTAIRFDTTILDADSQIGKMLDNLMQALERGDEAKHELKKAACLKCGSENHKVVNCPKCAASESERLLKEKMDKWESARNKKVTKLQGSANKSLGREAKIEGIVSVTTTLLDTGSDVTLVTAGVMHLPSRSTAKCSSSWSPWTPLVDQVAASSDECGDDGMHCTTLNIQVPSAENAEGQRNRR
ncbi:hypothetical protein DYB36_012964 [Aphanomyces astaci]|uniref:Peptidase A2 domain-containing protein n=1 Tax=Aphanomyces astaci TaxID=112090 RepID=A0A397A4R6_APHAT|nr:hypothetical protein DYB36_012964 [Aphanomyces astaci]